MNISNPLFRKFSRNRHGRDFVVGDVHGCFDLLRTALANVNFNESTDRLFSVGDLVDRGPSSEEVLDWLDKPWFFAVRGNHEQMAIGVAAGRHDKVNYAINGGSWFLDLKPEKQQVIAKMLDSLPLVMEVETPYGSIGIIHAEIEGTDWNEFLHMLETVSSRNKLNALMEQALWARDRIRYKIVSHIENIHRVYVGHTPVEGPTILGNVHYIDTGACFKRSLTLANLTDDTLHVFPASLLRLSQ